MVQISISETDFLQNVIKLLSLRLMADSVKLLMRQDDRDSFNPYVTNGLSHPYHLDESTFILGASGVVFHFYFIFDENYVSKQNSPRLNAAYCGGTSRTICVSTSHKKDIRLI